MGAGAYLRHELARRQRRNPGYSLRAFARDLGCDNATVSQWMREKRPVSDEALSRLCERLGIRGQGIEQVASFDPFDLVVLECAVRLPRPTVAEVAELCGCSLDEVNIATSRLLRLGMLRMEGDRWVALEKD